VQSGLSKRLIVSESPAAVQSLSKIDASCRKRVKKINLSIKS
jgi:hypothetical protein